MSETFLTQRRPDRNIKKKNVYLSYGKYQSFFSDFKETRIICTNIRKILKYQISWKSVQWKPSYSKPTDGRPDMRELINAFRNFAKAPNKENNIWQKTPFFLHLCGNNVLFVTNQPQRKWKRHNWKQSIKWCFFSRCVSELE